MIIKLKSVEWVDNIAVGPRNFHRAVVSRDVNSGVDNVADAIWYIPGNGVLVEITGQDDCMVPFSQIKKMTAAEKLTPEQWAGWDPILVVEDDSKAVVGDPQPGGDGAGESGLGPKPETGSGSAAARPTPADPFDTKRPRGRPRKGP